MAALGVFRSELSTESLNIKLYLRDRHQVGGFERQKIYLRRQRRTQRDDISSQRPVIRVSLRQKASTFILHYRKFKIKSKKYLAYRLHYLKKKGLLQQVDEVELK